MPLSGPPVVWIRPLNDGRSEEQQRALVAKYQTYAAILFARGGCEDPRTWDRDWETWGQYHLQALPGRFKLLTHQQPPAPGDRFREPGCFAVGGIAIGDLIRERDGIHGTMTLIEGIQAMPPYDSHPLLWEAWERTKARWKRELREDVQSLHALDLTWGAASGNSVLVREGRLWIFHFDHDYEPCRLEEGKRRDLEGLAQLFEHPFWQASAWSMGRADGGRGCYAVD